LCHFYVHPYSRRDCLSLTNFRCSWRILTTRQLTLKRPVTISWLCTSDALAKIQRLYEWDVIRYKIYVSMACFYVNSNWNLLFSSRYYRVTSFCLCLLSSCRTSHFVFTGYDAHWKWDTDCYQWTVITLER
jgi:hypothetical protein